MPKKSAKRRRAQPKADAPKEESQFKARPKVFSTGRDVRPKTHRLGRMIKWPKYVRVQRQEQVLKTRLKVPAAVAQFMRAADKGLAKQSFNLFKKYMPPTKAERKQNLKKIAELRSKGEEAKLEYTPQVKFGLNHVTNLVQRKEAQVVLIAHDVMPLELVVWLPTLCYKMGVPFIIVKGKSQLGQLVRMKNATCVALTKIRSGDQNELQNLIDSAKTNFNEKFEKSRTMPRLATMGLKTQHKLKKRAMKAAQ